MEEYIKNFKKKKHIKISSKESKKINLKPLVSKILISIIFFLISIIYTNINDENLLLYKEKVFVESFPFTKVKGWYENLFGEVLPNYDNTASVFEGKLVYKKIEDYYEGEKLTLNNNSIINSIQSGIVVYVGNKDNYGNTVIIQGVDGFDIWYGNLTNVSLKLYDYIEKNTIIGETSDENLYLVIKKDQEFIKYENYQNR